MLRVRLFLLLAASICCCRASAGDFFFQYATCAQTPESNETNALSATVYPMQINALNQAGIVAWDRLAFYTTNGSFVASNLQAGYYEVRFHGFFTTSTNWFDFPATNTVAQGAPLQMASNYIVGTCISGVPSFSMAQSDMRYVAYSSGGLTNHQGSVNFSNLTVAAPFVVTISNNYVTATLAPLPGDNSPQIQAALNLFATNVGALVQMATNNRVSPTNYTQFGGGELVQSPGFYPCGEQIVIPSYYSYSFVWRGMGMANTANVLTNAAMTNSFIIEAGELGQGSGEGRTISHIYDLSFLCQPELSNSFFQIYDMGYSEIDHCTFGMWYCFTNGGYWPGQLDVHPPLTVLARLGAGGDNIWSLHDCTFLGGAMSLWIGGDHPRVHDNNFFYAGQWMSNGVTILSDGYPTNNFLSQGYAVLSSSPLGDCYVYNNHFFGDLNGIADNGSRAIIWGNFFEGVVDYQISSFGGNPFDYCFNNQGAVSFGNVITAGVPSGYATVAGSVPIIVDGSDWSSIGESYPLYMHITPSFSNGVELLPNMANAESAFPANGSVQLIASNGGFLYSVACDQVGHYGTNLISPGPVVISMPPNTNMLLISGTASNLANSTYVLNGPLTSANLPYRALTNLFWGGINGDASFAVTAMYTNVNWTYPWVAWYEVDPNGDVNGTGIQIIATNAFAQWAVGGGGLVHGWNINKSFANIPIASSDGAWSGLGAVTMTPYPQLWWFTNTITGVTNDYYGRFTGDASGLTNVTQTVVTNTSWTSNGVVNAQINTNGSASFTNTVTANLFSGSGGKLTAIGTNAGYTFTTIAPSAITNLAHASWYQVPAGHLAEIDVNYYLTNQGGILVSNATQGWAVYDTNTFGTVTTSSNSVRGGFIRMPANPLDLICVSNGGNNNTAFGPSGSVIFPGQTPIKLVQLP